MYEYFLVSIQSLRKALLLKNNRTNPPPNQRNKAKFRRRDPMLVKIFRHNTMVYCLILNLYVKSNTSI